MSYASSTAHRDAADDSPAILSDREAAGDRAVAAAFDASAHAAWSCRTAAAAITAIATAVDALDTVDDVQMATGEPPGLAPTATQGADDAWADWRGCICGGGAYGEMVACDGGCDNWFHFECVGLVSAPRGEYICDACGAGFGFRRAYDDEDDDDNRALACLQENPKKAQSKSWVRYEAYKSATTVAEFLAKGGTPADLTHDVGKGFVWYLDADDSQEDGLEGALRSEEQEKAAGAALGQPRTAGNMLLRRKGTAAAPRNAPEKVTQHATRGAAKRAASEKPKPRKRAKAEAAFGNEQAPLLGLDVYHRDEADLRDKALGSPICIVRGLLKATTDDEDPFALPLLRRDHGATKVKMVLQRPMAKPGWKLPPQTSALRTLGPYIDAMRRDLSENTSPDTSKPLEFAANVDTSDDVMAPQLNALKTLLPAWLLWQSDEDALRFVRQGVPGMTAPQIYLKRKGVWTGGHEENLRFSSVNCCHGPGSSRWFAVDPKHAARVRTLVKEKCQVDIYVDEGNWWPDPAWLRSYGIPVREGLQKAGDVVVLKGGTLHWVVCDDLPSVHSSWNFGVQCASTFEAALERAALNDVIRYPNIIAVRSLLLDLAAHLVSSEDTDAKLLAVCSSSAAVVARAARRDEHAIKQARLGIEGEPEGALVIRCDGCGADLPVFYTRCDACFGCQNGTPFMCVGCGLRHRWRHKDISAVAKQSISEVEALSTKCASLCGAPAPDFTEQVLGKKRGAMKACPQCAKLIPNRCETCPACGGNAVKKRSSKKAKEDGVPAAWTDAAAALAVSAQRDPQKVVFGPQRGPRDVSAAPGLTPAAFELKAPSRAPSAGSWADLGAPPPGRQSSGSWGDLGVLAEPAALSTVVPAAAPAEPALLPPAYLDLAGVPAIVSPPNMRRVASEPYEPLLLDADVLRTAGPIHPLVLDDVLPVALVQTTP